MKKSGNNNQPGTQLVGGQNIRTNSAAKEFETFIKESGIECEKNNSGVIACPNSQKQLSQLIDFCKGEGWKVLGNPTKSASLVVARV